MRNELTRGDIEKMKEELQYRSTTLKDKLIEEVQTARAFGDLSENFEYKAAKKEKNHNDSRIRFLENMIKTAKIIDGESQDDTIGLYDTVTLYMEEDDEEEEIRLVTTMRQNALEGLISIESPVGKTLLGHREGDTVHIVTATGYEYDAVIRKVVKGTDDGSIPINGY